jgi:hypothetical protein
VRLASGALGQGLGVSPAAAAFDPGEIIVNDQVDRSPGVPYPSAGERLRRFAPHVGDQEVDYQGAARVQDRRVPLEHLIELYSRTLEFNDRQTFLSATSGALSVIAQDIDARALDGVPLSTLIGVHAALAASATPLPWRNLPGRLASTDGELK